MSSLTIRNKSLLVSLVIIAGFLFAVTLVSTDTDAQEVYPEIGDFTYLVDTSGTTAGVYAYNGTDETVTVPGTIYYEEKGYDIVRICDAAFANKNVTSVTLPISLKTIGEHAFEGCDNLTSITIPSAVTGLEWRCFASCDNLVTVTFGQDSQLTTLGGSAFVSCHKLATITIPDGVTSIGRFAFDGCSSLTSINIPDGVTKIEQETFEGCSSLTTVTFGSSSSVTEFEGSVFKGCSKLATFNLPATVTSMGYAALYGTSITSIDLSNVTTLGDEVFRGCKSLTTVTLNSGLTSIPSGLFDGCEKLSAITIPSGVTIIGGSAFEDCAALTSVTIPSGVTTIGGGAFENCVGLKAIVIPDSVTTIGDDCFENCKSATTLTIGTGISKIPFTAFDGLESLTSVTIPGNVKEIDYSFNGCVKLTDLTIQDGVETISGFNNCAFTTLTLPDSVIQVEDFIGCEKLTTVNIGAGLATFGDYRPFKSCPALKEFTVASGNLIFSAVDGVLYSDGGSTLCIYPQGKTSTSFTVLTEVASVDVTRIEERAFMENPYLEKVIIPEGVTTIGDEAFFNCYLKSISFPDSLTTVEDEVAYCLKFHYNDTTTVIDQTAENLKGKTWCGNGSEGTYANLYYFDGVSFTVTFWSDGDIVKEIKTDNYGKLSEPLPTPADKPGYTFDGWWTSVPGGVQITLDYVFIRDSNVYAKWEYVPGVVTGVSLDKTSNTIDVGDSFKLVATVTPSDAPNKDVTWKSSDTSVATVDQYGTVHGVAKGDAVITVTTVDGGKEATCHVYVGTTPPQPSEGGGVNIGLIIVIIVIILIAAGAAYYFFVYKKKNE